MVSSIVCTNYKFYILGVVCKKKKVLSVLDRIPFFYIKRLSSTNCQINWPLQMSSVAGTNYLDPIFEKALETFFVM